MVFVADPLRSWPAPACRIDDGGRVVARSPAFEAAFGPDGDVPLADGADAGGLAPGARWRFRMPGPGIQVYQAEVHQDAHGLVVTFADVTEVHCKAEHLSELFQHAPDAFIVIDRGGGIRYANDRADKMFGRPDEAIVGRQVETLMPERFRHGHLAHRAGYAAQPRVRPMGASTELFAVDADGQEFPVEISLAPIGAVEEGLFGAAIRDVTARRRQRWELERAVQRLQQHNQDLEAFAGRAAHDLRAPVRTIRMFVRMLRRSGGIDEDGLAWMQRVEASAERLDGLIQGLLELSGLRHDEANLAMVPLPDIMDQVVKDSAADVERTGGRFIVGDLPTVRGDPRLLYSVMSNLVGNAVRYRRPETPLIIHVEAAQTDAGWRIDVKDNGLGIADDVRERIFEPFERVHVHEPGHGIGLALCRRVAELHGGRIEALPCEGGAHIALTLPNAPAPTVQPPAHFS